MSGLIVERYIHDALNARASIRGSPDEAHRRLAQSILRDIELYCADHMDEVFAAHQRLKARDDADGKEMLAYVEEMLLAFAEADRAARLVLAKAGRS